MAQEYQDAVSVAPDVYKVLFENEQLARQNSDRPDTKRWYQMMLEQIEGQPEFIDTDIFRSYLV